jgi:hypothetical protein
MMRRLINNAWLAFPSDYMAMSKHDLERRKQNLKRTIEELELVTKRDPLMRNMKAHEELAKAKKQLAEMTG